MTATQELLERPGIAPSVGRMGRGRRRLWRFVVKQPVGAASAVVAILFVIVAVFADVLITHDVRELSGPRLQAPNAEYWFGTDHLGRDVYSRVIYGTRLSLVISLTAVVIGTTLGTVIGVVSAYIGGYVDLALQRVVDALLSFPGLIFAIALVGLVGPSVKNVAIAIGIVTAPSLSRIVRGPVLSVKQDVYVEAARSLGASGTRIMLRHILPNVTAVIIVVATARLGAAILIESGLSFLGLGPSPDTPTWGQMLSGDALFVMETAWWLALAPGAAITLVVLAFNLFGDTLRDMWDPRLRGG